jgi:hypothetical protein
MSCLQKTAKGSPCKNKVINGEYCTYHTRSVPVEPESIICKQLTAKGAPCKNKVISGEYCTFHIRPTTPVTTTPVTTTPVTTIVEPIEETIDHNKCAHVTSKGPNCLNDSIDGKFCKYHGESYLPKKCKGVTGKGAPCKNKVKEGKYCTHHSADDLNAVNEKLANIGGHESSSDEDEDAETIESVYILREREFVRTKENTVKIGMTKRSPNKRAGEYPKGSHVYFSVKVADSRKVEALLKKAFSDKFTKKPEYGVEYYNGDIIAMKREFMYQLDPFIYV